MDQIYDILQQLSQLDIPDVGIVLAIVASSGYVMVKDALRPLWQRVEGPIGFVISTLVVISLWVSLLRIHVSISFNIDKELFDNLLWLSALTFTPYYLIKYEMFERVALFFIRTTELVLDLFIFSWFEERAKANRAKWRGRLNKLFCF